jgi:hypothetical protein
MGKGRKKIQYQRQISLYLFVRTVGTLHKFLLSSCIFYLHGHSRHFKGHRFQSMARILVRILLNLRVRLGYFRNIATSLKGLGHQMNIFTEGLEIKSVPVPTFCKCMNGFKIFGLPCER